MNQAMNQASNETSELPDEQENWYEAMCREYGKGAVDEALANGELP